MKFAITMILALFVGLTQAEAASPTAKSLRVLFSSSNLSDATYSELLSATSRAVQFVSAFNTSPNPIDLAVGTAGNEVVHLTIPQGTLPGNGWSGSPVGQYTAAPVIFPMTIQDGRRLAIRAKNSSITLGELQVNLFY